MVNESHNPTPNMHPTHIDGRKKNTWYEYQKHTASRDLKTTNGPYRQKVLVYFAKKYFFIERKKNESESLNVNRDFVILQKQPDVVE